MNQKIKFYHADIQPNTAPVGSVWFDSTNNTVHVKTAEDPVKWEEYGPKLVTESPNYLKKKNNSELVVSGVQTLHTTTNKKILVTGGPLAELLNEAGITEFDAETDLQTILERLFCKEIYPTVELINPEFIIEIPEPDILAYKDEGQTASISNGAVLRIGTDIYFDMVKYPDPSFENKSTPAKLSGMINGFTYAIPEKGKDLDIVTDEKGNIINAVETDWSDPEPKGNSEGEDPVWTISPDASLGLKDNEKNNEFPEQKTTSDLTDGLANLGEWQSAIALGENTYSVTCTSPSYSAVNGGTKTLYPVSNLGQVDETLSYQIEEQDGLCLPGPATATFTVYGVYPVYTNIYNDTTVADCNTEIIGNNAEQTTFDITYKNINNQANNVCQFGYPGDRTITVQLYNATFNTWNDIATGNDLIELSDRTVNNTTYNTWKYVGRVEGGGTLRFKFELSKKISE